MMALLRFLSALTGFRMKTILGAAAVLGTAAGVALGFPVPAQSGAAVNTDTPIPIVPLVTMTPRPDGTIIHEVGYGQTLWSIALAYDVQISQIRVWNNLPANSTSIYAGQKLLVRPLAQVTQIPETGGSGADSGATPTPAATFTVTVPAAAPTAGMAGAVQPAQNPTEPVRPVEAGSAPAGTGTSNNLLLVAGGASILLGLGLLFLARRFPYRRTYRY